MDGEGENLMYLLKMSGYPITNIIDYRRYFNLYDALRQQKEFLSFSLTHFSRLSSTYRYCAAMVYAVIENRIPVFMCDCMDETEEIDFRAVDATRFWDNPFAFCQTAASRPGTKEMSDELMRLFAPMIGDIVYLKALFLSIAAFTFLGASPSDIRLDTDRVKMSFLGQENRSAADSFMLCFDDDGTDNIRTITLDPSARVYTVEPYDGADFHRIKTFRIAASKKIRSLSHRTVRISAGDTELTIPAGEHIYVNTINGKLANILDKSRIKNNHTLCNTGIVNDVLSFDNQPELPFYGNEYISSFDFSEGDRSILYLNNLRLCTDRCTSPALKERLSGYTDLSLVEIKLLRGHFYLLKNNGELLTSDPTFDTEKNVFSIDSLLRSHHQ